MDNYNVLIIGGTSGLGWSLANELTLDARKYIYITGSNDPTLDLDPDISISFYQFNIDATESYLENSKSLLKGLPSINVFIYAAGYYQEGSITDISEADIKEMNNVGLLAPAILIRAILEKQGSLDGLITITSTSQWTPRLNEPMYTAVKSGLGMLTNSLSLDSRIKKSLVVGPAGMKTKFWHGTEKDTSTMLDTNWVAQTILKLYAERFNYMFVKILREPPRYEMVERR